MISLDQPLDLDDSDAIAFLAKLQGNIIKAHARDHAMHVLVRFGADPAIARRLVADFAETTLTTAADQARQIDLFHAGRDSGPFATVALSASGMAALGIPPAQQVADATFRNGLKQSQLAASDPPVAQWEQFYQGDVHALITLADQNEGRLATSLAAIEAMLRTADAEIHVEPGDAIQVVDPIYGRQNKVHFGFADGLSQPETIKQDIAQEVAANGNASWDPGAPLSLLLQTDAGGYGSYLVFRKLEQNVRGFYDSERRLAGQLGLSGADAAQVEGMIVGRRRNGEAAIAPGPHAANTPGNDFDFDDDRFGVVCPFHAHIRRTNPRGDLSSPGIQRPAMPREVERGFRIARRGIPYGDSSYLAGADIEQYPIDGVGLLFMSFQSRLLNFEIQQGGCDDNNFPMPEMGVDATIGRSTAAVAQDWYFPSAVSAQPGPSVDDQGRVRFSMANFVTLKGGEYFYAPSPDFLRALST